MKPTTRFANLPEAQFRLVVWLFMAQHDSISFQHKVIRAHDEIAVGHKLLGGKKSNQMAIKRLQALSDEAKRESAKTMKANVALMAAMGMPVD